MTVGVQNPTSHSVIAVTTKGEDMRHLKYCYLWHGRKVQDFLHAAEGREMHQKCASLTQDAW